MTKPIKDQPETVSRRSFLQRSLLMGAGAAGAAALSEPLLAMPEELTEQKSEQDGYRLSKHIADYYKSAEV